MKSSETVINKSQRAFELLWYSLVFLLLFTSLPLVAALVRTDSVAAPAVIPAALLFIFWLFPKILKGQHLPFLILPFFAVVSVLVLATILAFFDPVLPVKGLMPIDVSLNALITLSLAVVVYIIAATFPNTRLRLKNTLGLVNVIGLIMIAWSLVQIYYILAARGEFPDWMHTFQSWVSIRRLFHKRATGFAYEPSWLAHQLNMVFLPYWLAASMKGFSAHRRRLGKLTVENLLLLGGVFVLALSFSRIGWISFGLGFAIVLFLLTSRLSNAIQSRIFKESNPSQAYRITVNALIIGLFAIIYIAIGLGSLELAGRFDNRLEDFFLRIEGGEDFYQLTNKFEFAERTISWGTGWEIFNENPFMGVGLGQAGFHFVEEMPSFGWLLNEIKDIYYRQPYLFNTKNLWTRLLAESGIIGFTVFLSWVYLLWKSARSMQQSEDPLLSALGWTGIFFIPAMVVEGFSIDSFALPFIWFTAGLLTAATHFYLSSTQNQNQET